jgi:predicted ATP-dependent endonuclease of OLD family
MHIEFIEIANFRKLLSVRVDLSETTTLFVGANNSGKTSAMLALRKFLSPRSRSFEIHDFTLCHWPTINAIGQRWIDSRAVEQLVELKIADWANLVPTLDLWLRLASGELHYTRDLIPTLDWEGGLLGVRLRYEPKDLQLLYKDFLAAFDAAQAIKTAAKEAHREQADGKEQPAPPPTKLTVWPTNLVDFLSRRLSQHFQIHAYLLDPAAIAVPEKSQAKPQVLADDALPIEGDPLAGLIRINDNPAHRGFGEAHTPDGDDSAPGRPISSRLSDQLRAYYAKHLDPRDRPDPHDLGALQAIEAAQNAFDARLTESFTAAFSEVEEMGYPGVTDPRPKVSTRLNAIDGLNHSAAVSFEVDVVEEDGVTIPLLRLPEDNNGLGYQNLISMIFRLMAFRDGWMRVGKAANTAEAPRIEPLHLVLVEEPEAHLHAQVQQVFIKKAYAVLRKHDDLGEKKQLRTQLVVSTHSSHVAHETPFACLRYFRRLPAGMPARVPVSTVINLSEVFGPEKDTERFVTRYLRAQHADLFFADAAILVEGPAERMLLPNFIRAKHEFLSQCYITMLEIGGSHAHRLRELIEKLGLLTLIVTDLDSLASAGGASVQPAPKTGQVTNNATLKTWLPMVTDIDALYAADAEKKTKRYDPLFAVRVGYQTPLQVIVPKTRKQETAYPYTFEDSFAFENLDFFGKLEGYGLVAKFRDAITNETTTAPIGAKMYTALKVGKKAEFALEIIDAQSFDNLTVPRYIAEGLEWLEEQLRKKQAEILPVANDTPPLTLAEASADGSTCGEVTYTGATA